MPQAGQIRTRLAGQPAAGQTGPVIDFAAYAAASRPLGPGDRTGGRASGED